MRTGLAAVAAGLALLAAGCAGGRTDTIRIGVYYNCAGFLSAFSEFALAGAELPWLARGARRAGREPAAGIAGATVAGKHVELVFGCNGGTNGLAELRRLVEQEGADVVVGMSLNDGVLFSGYARRRPGTAFSLASIEQVSTLRQPAANVFRFSLDWVQWQAGLGTYAYRELGWRTAVTIGQDDPVAWPLAEGFLAEFCALGGRIVKRLWLPLNPASTDLSRFAARIPARGVDGVYVSGITSDFVSLLEAFGRRQPELSRRVILGWPASGLTTLHERLLGVVTAMPFPLDASAPPWVEYRRSLDRWFPGLYGRLLENPFAAMYHHPTYNAMEAVAVALERVQGDLSGGERRFMAALQRLRLDVPNGPIRLDVNRQAVAPNYLLRVERNGQGRVGLRPWRVVPSVEQTYGGRFSAATPVWTGRTTCRKGKPPSWAR